MSDSKDAHSMNRTRPRRANVNYRHFDSECEDALLVKRTRAGQSESESEDEVPIKRKRETEDESQHSQSDSESEDELSVKRTRESEEESQHSQSDSESEHARPAKRVKRKKGGIQHLRSEPATYGIALDRMTAFSALYARTVKNPQSTEAHALFHHIFEYVSVYSGDKSDERFRPIYAYLAAVFQDGSIPSALLSTTVSPSLLDTSTPLYDNLTPAHKHILKFLLQDLFDFVKGEQLKVVTLMKSANSAVKRFNPEMTEKAEEKNREVLDRVEDKLKLIKEGKAIILKDDDTLDSDDPLNLEKAKPPKKVRSTYIGMQHLNPLGMQRHKRATLYIQD